MSGPGKYEGLIMSDPPEEGVVVDSKQWRSFIDLAKRMSKGREKYPRGCTVLSLLDEAGEFTHAVNKEEHLTRMRDELLDVAAVAMRLYLGEVDASHHAILAAQYLLRDGR